MPSVGHNSAGHASTPLNSFTLVANQPQLPDRLSRIPADTTAPAEIPLVYETSKAKRVDVSYVQKVLDGQHELPAVNRFQREVYRKSEAQSLKIRLWFDNGKPSQTLAVSNPAAPWFHPKDCEPITRLASAPCTSYYYWDSGDRAWILTDAAVKVKPNTDILFLRLENVVDCLDGPHAKSKRRLSDNSSQSQTPKSNRSKSAASGRPNISPLFYGAVPVRRGSIVELSSSDEEEDDEEEVSNNVQCTAPLATASSSLLPDTGTLFSSDTSIATPKFPLDFACDMDAGFQAMKHDSGKIPARFVRAFHVDWVSSTYYMHSNFWQSLDPHVLEYAVQCGHGYGGDWKALMKGKGKA
ncbi:hypothetical protein K438DRAFT_2000538 [Mycena galopus ATCC 62051]|nr:hypothetical protein K438DRAFT_2000538 [Mycena galopus ATCC 62051]